MVRRPVIWLAAVFSTVAAVVGVGVFGLRAVEETLKQKLAAELAKEGLALEIGHLSINPLRGVIAHDIRLAEYASSGHQLLQVDELGLDIDPSRLIRRDPITQVLRNITLSRAHLRLPVDPSQPEAQLLELAEVSSRLSFSQGEVEIRHLSGLLAGRVLVRASGTVNLRPQVKKHPPGFKEPTAKEQFEAIKQRRQTLATVTDIISQFQFPGEPPVVDVKLDGPLNDLSKLHAEIKMEAGSIRYGPGAGWQADQVSFYALLADGMASLQRCEISDPTGRISARGDWQIGARDVDFSFHSTGDLPGLLQALLPRFSQLREINFYQSPRFTLSGVCRLPRTPESDTDESAAMKLTVEGDISCGQFGTRGAIFEAFQAGFYLNGDDFHVRQLHLAHRTGTLSGKVMQRHGQLRYEAQVQMDPSVAAPLVSDEKMKAFLSQLKFGSGSSLVLKAAGNGPRDESALGSQWLHRGEIDARDFSFKEAAARRLQTDFTFQDGKLTTHTLQVDRTEGRATVPFVEVDLNKKLLTIRGLKSNIWPVPILETFNHHIAAEVARYPFTLPPEATLDGVIDLHGTEDSDYTIHMKSPGDAGYPLTGQMIPLTQPHGVITIKKMILGLDIRSEVKPGTSYANCTFKGTPMVTFQGNIDLDRQDGDETAWSAVLAAPGRSDYLLYGKELPLQNLAVRMNYSKERLDITQAQAQLFEGEVAGTALLDWHKGRNTYTAAVEARSLSFGQLARLYSPSTQTAGSISGGIHFNGKTDGSLPIRGGGSLTIRNGNIFAIPILGPLSPLMATVLPGKNSGYGVANEASCSFTVADNLFATKDFEAKTGLFVIKAGGGVNTANRQVALEARVNVRGPTGLLFYLPGQLLAYEADGTLDDPKWKPKLLSLPMKILPGGR